MITVESVQESFSASSEALYRMGKVVSDRQATLEEVCMEKLAKDRAMREEDGAKVEKSAFAIKTGRGGIEVRKGKTISDVWDFFAGQNILRDMDRESFIRKCCQVKSAANIRSSLADILTESNPENPVNPEDVVGVLQESLGEKCPLELNQGELRLKAHSVKEAEKEFPRAAKGRRRRKSSGESAVPAQKV